MLKDFERSFEAQVELVAHCTKSLLREHIGEAVGDDMIALMPIAKLETPCTKASGKAIERFRGCKVGEADWTFPCLDRATDKYVVVEKLSFDAKSGLKTRAWGNKSSDVVHVEDLTSVGKRTEGNEISECEPCHGGPPCRESITV